MLLIRRYRKYACRIKVSEVRQPRTELLSALVRFHKFEPASLSWLLDEAFDKGSITIFEHAVTVSASQL